MEHEVLVENFYNIMAQREAERLKQQEADRANYDANIKLHSWWDKALEIDRRIEAIIEHFGSQEEGGDKSIIIPLESAPENAEGYKYFGVQVGNVYAHQTSDAKIRENEIKWVAFGAENLSPIVLRDYASPDRLVHADNLKLPGNAQKDKALEKENIFTWQEDFEKEVAEIETRLGIGVDSASTSASK